KLQLQRDQLQRKIDTELLKEEKPTWAENLLRWQRFGLLSGVSTLGKLGAAATGRLTLTPIEEAVGAVAHITPGLRSISERAPREGGGINLKAERDALLAFFHKVSD